MRAPHMLKILEAIEDPSRLPDGSTTTPRLPRHIPSVQGELDRLDTLASTGAPELEALFQALEDHTSPQTRSRQAAHVVARDVSITPTRLERLANWCSEILGIPEQDLFDF